MREEILDIDIVHQRDCCMGHKTSHPLVSIIDLSKAPLGQCIVRYDFYTITLIEGEAEHPMYGREYCNYPNASLILRIPGEIMKLDTGNALAQKGWSSALHPDPIACVTLESHIKDYSFLFYKLNESLHLLLRKKMKTTECTRNIEEELQHATGCHSKTLISRHIELLPDYCARFNEHQFTTRCEVNETILHKTDLPSSKYILSSKLTDGVLSTEKCRVDALHLSPRYFNDLLKFEIRKSIHEYFQLMRLDITRRTLLNKDSMVHMTARRLGYANVRYFTLLFEKITRITPAKYKYTQN